MNININVMITIKQWYFKNYKVAETNVSCEKGFSFLTIIGIFFGKLIFSEN